MSRAAKLVRRLCLASVFFIPAFSAHAGNPGECAVYANAAIQQVMIAQQNQCGYGGPRWTTQYDAHFTWCLAVDKGARNFERNARNQELQQCAGGGEQPAQDAMYKEPSIGGARLDWCRVWAGECGKPAADAYCQSKGHAISTGFKQASNIGAFEPTKVISSGQVCAQGDCDGFAWIKCGG